MQWLPYFSNLMVNRIPHTYNIHGSISSFLSPEYYSTANRGGSTEMETVAIVLSTTIPFPQLQPFEMIKV